MKVYSWQTVDQLNLAEQVCRPTDYFPEWDVEVLPQDCHNDALLQGPVIFGASGLLYPEIAGRLKYAADHSTHPLIAWGIGHNTHYGTERSYPSWLDSFALVGLRDPFTKYPYLPCPSCLNSAFDQDYGAPQHSLVVYDQKDYPVKLDTGELPRISNAHAATELPYVLEFLSSGNTVLTSSYHGAYWAALLGRRVLLWKPWSTKFTGLISMVDAIIDESADINAVLRFADKQPRVHDPAYLRLSRHLNNSFSGKVAQLLGIGSYAQVA